jgi:hypothetical protein
MRVLVWHVHGSYTTSLVQGPHDYLVPVVPDRGPDGRGRARTWDWPANAREVTPEQLRHEDVDVVVLQRPHEVDRVERSTGRTTRPPSTPSGASTRCSTTSGWRPCRSST